jgi:DNA-binding Lrp family transcriptional regulator
MRYLQKTKSANKVELDLKDKRILSLLAKNVRSPLTKIAKEVKLSRDAVSYRIKNYQKKGLIQGYITSVDISKFGYKNYHLFLKLNNPSKETEKNILKKISSLPFVRAVLKYSGNYDLEIGLVAKDFKELDAFIEKITFCCSNFLQEYELLLILDTYIAKTFPVGFFEEPKRDTKENNERDRLVNERYKLDNKDIQILKIISQNSIASLSYLSQKINLSIDAVSYRMKKMYNAGIILSYMPVLNYTSLDYSLYGLLININPLNEENKKILNDFIHSNKSVLWAVKTIGKFNTLIYFLVSDIEEFQENMISLRGLFPRQVNIYEALIAYEEYKYVYFPEKLF